MPSFGCRCSSPGKCSPFSCLWGWVCVPALLLCPFADLLSSCWGEVLWVQGLPSYTLTVSASVFWGVLLLLQFLLDLLSLPHTPFPCSSVFNVPLLPPIIFTFSMFFSPLTFMLTFFLFEDYIFWKPSFSDCCCLLPCTLIRVANAPLCAIAKIWAHPFSAAGIHITSKNTLRVNSFAVILWLSSSGGPERHLKQSQADCNLLIATGIVRRLSWQASNMAARDPYLLVLTPFCSSHLHAVRVDRHDQ